MAAQATVGTIIKGVFALVQQTIDRIWANMSDALQLGFIIVVLLSNIITWTVSGFQLFNKISYVSS